MLSTIRVVVFLSLVVADLHAVANTVTTAKEECRKRIAECMMNGGGNMPVCGSDGITYSSQCEAISRQCKGVSILIKHTGPCPETPACFSAKLTARTGAEPTCRQDGTYAPVQCHAETGYCWCVTPQGRPLPDTSVRHKRPRCLRPGSRSASAASTRSGQRRRSPNFKQRRQYDSNRHRNTCDRNEKAKFNANLIENFKIEYRRTNISADGDKDVGRVLSWKFATLDKDGDGFLNRTEYKELRRLAKKAVRPKKCARTFARTCDLNRDLKLSKQEWGACLVNDFTHERPEVPEAQRTRATDQVLKGSPAPIHSKPTFTDELTDTKEENDAIDCTADRKAALEDQIHSEEKFYVPECTPDGRYLRIQCYSGYCWCVYQDTGKPIPGTSAKNLVPNCNPVPTPSRPMKGCPDLKKQLFLRDLMDLMQTKMKESNTESDETTTNWQASKEERIATWHFVMLDKNKNKVLERKEWKSFREMVANNKQLRRCGKKLPRYCDINNDRKISMTEWLSCLNAQRSTTGDNMEKASTSKPKRMGPNPLDKFLNDDD
ncbi:PREDICTED: SPARC-related modular calcium-binding protein 2 isoform X2 [Dinoponera quadriceps]|uniref:SPARC-related modular calcium-binding protein 2 isoform X2 n=1 Tax=Dinoponera quadriceps TaxID=609295 RepID=A0A6P3WN80_DINQU|nr:PREDICTED: SPARC-related modular calcium-binding protein 2 isoform X2 [Dinoponera quadriceps]